MKQPLIYFFLAPKIELSIGGANSLIQDDVIPIAEGFKALGIPFYANVKYWQINGKEDDYLFQYDRHIMWKDCDMVIFSYHYFHRLEETKIIGKYNETFILPSKELQSFKGIKVCFDFHDGYETFSFKKEFEVFDFIFRCKYNRLTTHPKNHVPWQLGVSERILNATKDYIEFKKRNKSILWNFGASHPYPHGLRELAKKRILPHLEQHINFNKTLDNLNIIPESFSEYDQLMWAQSARRHNPNYYNRLKTSIACASFCGELIPGLPFDPSVYLKGGNKALIKKKLYSLLSKALLKKERIIQWDSWRFWESLAAGCVPIHIDLEKYGVALPVMPINWKHYIGIDLDHIERDVDRIFEDEKLLEEISLEGHTWLLENYSPEAVAKRFLNIITKKHD